ncbi:DUF2059 domain-containing protein [Janthinobacterium sp. Mn2066]|uniref:DUF2059 domain-containing protein n=1 Tax=Janthinobacterium sp. Mn2066 TaxID=3395264 RepID=UPI003BD68AD1
MKKILSALLASLMLFTASASHAQDAAPAKQDPAAVRAVQDLMEAQKMRVTLQAMFAQMAQKMDEAMYATARQAAQDKSRLTDSQRQQLQAAMAPMLQQFSATMKSTFTDPALVDEYIVASVPVYLNHFSVAEIEQMTAFYRSPVGVKFVAATPKLMQEMVPASERIIMPRMLEMQQQFGQQLEQIKKDILQQKPQQK